MATRCCSWRTKTSGRVRLQVSSNNICKVGRYIACEVEGNGRREGSDAIVVIVMDMSLHEQKCTKGEERREEGLMIQHLYIEIEMILPCST